MFSILKTDSRKWPSEVRTLNRSYVIHYIYKTQGKHHIKKWIAWPWACPRPWSIGPPGISVVRHVWFRPAEWFAVDFKTLRPLPPLLPPPPPPTRTIALAWQGPSYGQQLQAPYLVFPSHWQGPSPGHILRTLGCNYILWGRHWNGPDPCHMFAQPEFFYLWRALHLHYIAKTVLFICIMLLNR